MEEIINKAKELASFFSETAENYDLKGEFPVANFELLKKENFLALMIPKEFGGLGANFSTYTKVISVLAAGDLSTALCYNMHNISVGTLAEVDLSKTIGRMREKIKKFQQSVFAEIYDHKKVFASASSEPGVGSNFSRYKTTYARQKDGFVINGTKSFVSLSSYADYYVVPAKPVEKEDSSTLSLFIVAKSNTGVKILNDWNPIALKQTISNTVLFENCFVETDALFLGIEGMAFYKVLREPHWVIGGFSAAYLGLCNSTFQFVTDFVKSKRNYKPGVSDLLETQIGKLAAELEISTQMVTQSALMVDQKQDWAKTEKLIFLAKYIINNLVTKITSEGLKLCGGSSLSKNSRLERFYREASCCNAMPANQDQCLLYLGREALGADFKKIENHVW